MQIFLNGLINGLLIAVLALAFKVVHTPTRIFHIALAAVYAIAPYILWASLQWKLPWYFGVMAAVLFAIGLSLFLELLNHAPLERKGASPGIHLISSLGIYIIIIQIIAISWGNETKAFRTELDTVFSWGDIILTSSQTNAAMVSVFSLLLFFIWLRFTNLGLLFRALADNPVEFVLRGYNMSSLRLVAFGISGLLGAVAALLTSYDIGFTPYGGLPALLLAIVAMIVGGKWFIMGPIFGGILLGIVRSEVGWFLSALWENAVTFLILAFFLFLRGRKFIMLKSRPEVER